MVINVSKITDSNFPRTIARYMSKWTGRIWKVTRSNSNIGKTLQEEDIINQQKEIALMKNDPDVKLILETFPGTKIHSITSIAETSSEKDVKVEQKQLKRE